MPVNNWHFSRPQKLKTGDLRRFEPQFAAGRPLPSLYTLALRCIAGLTTLSHSRYLPAWLDRVFYPQCRSEFDWISPLWADDGIGREALRILYTFALTPAVALTQWPPWRGPWEGGKQAASNRTKHLHTTTYNDDRLKDGKFGTRRASSRAGVNAHLYVCE